jgi:cytochrome c553
LKKVLLLALLFLSSSTFADAPDELIVTPEQTFKSVAQRWNKHCAKCHDSEGNSTKLGARLGSPTNIYNYSDDVSADDIFKVLYEGRNKMPSFKKKLSEEDLKEIALHIEYSALVKRVRERRAELKKKLKEIKKDFPNLPPCDTIKVQ